MKLTSEDLSNAEIYDVVSVYLGTGYKLHNNLKIIPKLECRRTLISNHPMNLIRREISSQQYTLYNFKTLPTRIII